MRTATAFLLTVASVGSFALLLGRPLPRVAAAEDPKSPEYYTEKVQPILQANCYKCHAGMNHRGGLHLDSKDGILKGGKDGAVIVPGDAANSLLIKLIRHEGPADDPMPMPPRSKISDDDIATVTKWVANGAVMP